jgi:hypothetical protein
MALSIMTDGTKKRVIIVHVHMFKNAGSTFDWSLKKNFGKDFIDHRDDTKMRTGAKYLGPFLEENSQIKAISSHHIRLPLPEDQKWLCLPVFILRHPIDRIGSVYAFHKKQKSDTLGAIKAKEMPFSEYVRWFMDISQPATLRDFQTRYCSGQIGTIKSLTENDYNDALQSLYNTPLVGIVERYAESMVLFEHHLKDHFPSIDLSYKKQNVGNRQAVSFETRIEILKKELGENLINQVIENNKYDFMLYDEAKRLLTSRVTDLAGFDKRVSQICG